MYAITSTSFRAIASSSDVLPGETASDVIPDTLVLAFKSADMRQQRDALLAACDWTQGADSPLDATTKSAWAAYREALRSVPQQSGFPTTITWPTAPSTT